MSTTSNLPFAAAAVLTPPDASSAPAGPATPMAVEQAAALTDFARTCKAAARAVSLYPGAHPAIAASLSRLLAAAAALGRGGDVSLVVHPTALFIGDRTPARPDAALGELAALLHGRLIGALRLMPGASVDDWRQFLLLLARPVEELIAAGGPARAWAETGRGHFEIVEIDYAAVLKERSGGATGTWDRLITSYLKNDSVPLDDAIVDMLLAAFSDQASLTALVDRLQEKADEDRISIPARIATLFRLLKAAIAAAESRGLAPEALLATLAQSSGHFSADMILGLVAHRDLPETEDGALAGRVLEGMTDASIATFVARSVAAERGATARLAHAFEALVPDDTRKTTVLELARADARDGALGHEPQFEQIWEGAAKAMLDGYSDEHFVSDDYARELTAARTQAIEVERLSDDPPERIAEWLGSVSEHAIRDLDLSLTLDLLRLEEDEATWTPLAAVAVREIEQRTLAGELGGGLRLVEALSAAAAGPRPDLRVRAAQALDALATGPFARHVTTQLRRATDADSAAMGRLCRAIGPVMVRVLAESLAAEEHVPTIRRLKEVLIGFGAAGRQAIEPLRSATNPAVRRTAIDLLRLFGGNEALKELTAMLSDADPQVQQDSIRAIVQIGTKESYAVLARACAASPQTRRLVVFELVSLRDAKAVTPLCHVLTTTELTGETAEEHEAIVEALGGLRAHPESTAALALALHRGMWWAPRRTTRLRQAAARGLRRLASPEARAALVQATETGSRSVRRIAESELASFTDTGSAA